jgi:hypothetical protein
MKKSLIITGILLYLAFNSKSLAQSSIIPIYNEATEVIKVFEEQGYQIVHLDFNILTLVDPTEETRRSFSDLYDYVILAYGDESKLKKIKLELYISENTGWKNVSTGKPLMDNTNPTAFLTLTPTEIKDYLIKIVAEEFASGSKSGRIFFAVGNKLRKSSVESSARESVRWNRNTNNLKYSDYQSFSSTFEISVAEHLVKHTIYDTPIIYYIKEKGSTEAQEKLGIYTYTCETIGGTPYILTIDTVQKTLMIIEFTGKTVLNGYVYHLNGDIM